MHVYLWQSFYLCYNRVAAADSMYNGQVPADAKTWEATKLCACKGILQTGQECNANAAER